MPVISVNKAVDPKRIIGKKEGQRGGEAQGVADPKEAIPGANPTIASYNASIVKIYSAVNSMARF
jgi:hypothetical protein